MKKQTQRILVKAPNWIGDALLSTPALTSLGKAFPDSRITVLAAPWVAPLLETHPAVKRVLIYDPKGRHRSWLARGKFFKLLRSYNFDTAILFPNSLHSALIAFLSSIPRRTGYATDGRKLLLSQSVPLKPNSKTIHQAEYYLDLLRTMGIEIHPDDKHLVLKLTAPEKQWAKNFLAQQSIDNSKILTAIHPGAVKPGKRWPYKRFVRVGQELVKKHNAHLLLLGSKNEKVLLEQIQAEISSASQTIVCGTSLRKVAALLECCRLFIGNDSGLMHMATALNTPIVAIFGPGTPQTTAPYNQDLANVIVMKDFSCRPCRQRFFSECRPSPEGVAPCLDAVQAQDVLAGVEKLLTTA